MKEKVVFASSLSKQYQIGDLTIEALRNLDLEVGKGVFVSVPGVFRRRKNDSAQPYRHAGIVYIPL